MMIKDVLSRQLVWKTVAVGISAAAIIAGLGLANPFATESAFAEDATTAQGVSEVKAAMESGEITAITINIDDVIAPGNTEPTGEFPVPSAVSCEADEQAVIQIAKADPEVNQLLAAGASLGDVSTINVCGTLGNVATGETETTSEILVMVAINGAEDSYTAFIDLAEGKVTKVLKAVTIAPPSPEGESFFSIPDLAQS